MRNTIYTLFAIIFISASCSVIRDMKSSRAERELMTQENVKKAIESQQILVKVNRLHTGRGRIMDINPTDNFIIIDRNLTRVSLAYMGRSFTTRPIAAINFTGQVYSSVVDTKRDGSYDIVLELGQENEKFKVNMIVSKGGYVSLTITNPRIDFVRYSGNLGTL
ncbi:MAG TPA: DUF4251 domain-containing protein [Bacteroidetes bacterium]|nr:DUF4251 domain-containing protein [Bacteroidota bacterium]